MDLNPSLRDSEYFRDLQARPGGEREPSLSPLSVFIDAGDKTQLSPGLFFSNRSSYSSTSPKLHCGSFIENLSPSHSKMNLLPDQGETMDSTECLDEIYVDDLDRDSFPILVRSMSTSRRHSSDIPLNPLALGRR